MNEASPLAKIRAGAFDVVAFDGRLRVVRRRDGATVGSLPIVDEPTFGAALKEAVERVAASTKTPSAAGVEPEAEPEPEPKKKRRRSKAKAKTVEPEPAPEPKEPAATLEENDDETSST